MTPDLHPQVQALLSGPLKPQTPETIPNVADVRAANARNSALLGGPPEPLARIWETSADTSRGPVRLRWYEPADVLPQSLLLYVHGGGWVAGTLDSYDTLCSALALRSGFHVASIDYSLSPETLYPHALHQVADILRDARSLARAAGLEIRTLAAAGDSAGGALIASAFDHLLSHRQPLPDAAALLYPVADASLAYDSYPRLGTGYSLTTDRMRWFWEQYLGQDLQVAGDLLLDPGVAPIHSPHLGSFPPTLVLTTAFDPLHDEGEAFARRLEQAGAPVEYIEVPGQIHGFLRFREALTDPLWGPDAVLEKVGDFLVRVTHPGADRHERQTTPSPA